MKHKLNLPRLAIAFTAASALTGCASSPAASPEIETRVALDESGRITYVGDITTAANERVMEIFEGSQDKPATLLIFSGGGPIEAGLDLGEWILDHNLDVEVGDLCFSSCANYVFLAGNVKKLRRGSVLMWHGSAWQESFDRFADPNDAEYRPSFVEARERETRFFDRIGVDNLITVYGQGLGVRWRDRLRWLFGGGALLGFDYDLDDLQRLGVSNIELVDGDWNWREYAPEWASRVRRVSLEEDYELTLNRFGDRWGPNRLPGEPRKTTSRSARRSLLAPFLLNGRILEGRDAPSAALFRHDHRAHGVSFSCLAARAEF